MIDDALGGLRARLQEVLAPSFRVAPESALSKAAAVVVRPDVRQVERLRAAHPNLLIVVYDGVGADPTPYLDARADDHVGGVSIRELAARLRAGIRRLEWEAED